MILVALGANFPSPAGSPPETLAAACQRMVRRGLNIAAASRIWTSAPVPASDQPWYHNAVVRIETPWLAHRVMKELMAIEESFGRVRTARNEARVLDLDMLTYHDVVMDSENLILPHPRMQERAFVLLPLQEIAPDWVHPVSGQPLAAMIAALPPQEIRVGEPLAL